MHLSDVSCAVGGDARNHAQGLFLHLLDHKALKQVNLPEGEFSTGPVERLIRRWHKPNTVIIRERVCRSMSDWPAIDKGIHDVLEAFVAPKEGLGR